MTTNDRDLVFVGAKGGVGTTTVAALHAIQAARAGHQVRLTASDAAGLDDLAAVLGIPTPGEGQIVQATPGLSLADHRDPDSLNVLDAGTDCFSDHVGRVHVVLRNDFLSLRRALASPRTTAGFILITEPQRALGSRNVEDVLAYPIVAEIAVDPRIARAVDAGLLTTIRLPLGLAPLHQPTPAP